MSTPPIMPLARQLAEENNVDWRTLSGSGEGGRVVEDDVLAHLAQVMLGRAAVDPTPEPLPEGLDAWLEEAAYRRDPPQATKAADKAASEVAGEIVGEAVSDAGSPWTLEPQHEHPSSDAHARADTLERSNRLEAARAFSFLNTQPDPAAEHGNDHSNHYSDNHSDHHEGGGAYGEVQAQLEGAALREDSGAFGATFGAFAPHEPQSTLQAPPDEVQLLRSRVAALEDERARHLHELHQLARLQETLEAQKAEKARGETLQKELRAVTGELARVGSEAERLPPLEAKLHDLEERLSRARLFRSKAKDELERLSALSESLQEELKALKKRRWWSRNR